MRYYVVMKTWLLRLCIFALTLCIGYSSVGFYLQFLTKTSLETISSQIEHYDGKTITTETYLWAYSADDEALMLGEPFEKNERSTFVKPSPFAIDVRLLGLSLRENRSTNHFKRVRVIVNGKLEDNCRKGSIPCCFGQNMTIDANRIIVTGEVEDYTVPVKFQSPEPN